MITLKDIQNNDAIRALISAGNRYLEALGYTDHGPRHVGFVSHTARELLETLGYAIAMGWAVRIMKGVSGDLAGFALSIAEVCGLALLAII